MQRKKSLFMLIALVMLSCFTFSACGTSKASQEKMDNAAERIYRAANSTLEEMGLTDYDVQGDYVICSDPNYNYFKKSGTGLYSYYTVNTENEGKTLENNVYTFYSYISSHYSDADDYEYVIEVISGEVKHVYAAKSWDSKTVGTVHKNKNPVYLTSEYTTLQDVADSVGEPNTSSQYSFTEGNTEKKNSSSSSFLSSYDYYELLDGISEKAMEKGFSIFLICFILALLICLLGYNYVYRVASAAGIFIFLVLSAIILSLDNLSFYLYHNKKDNQ